METEHINPALILHCFTFGEVNVDQFIDMARTLGYKYIVWNGRIYSVPERNVSWYTMCEKHDVGVYEDVTGEKCPTYNDHHIHVGLATMGKTRHGRPDRKKHGR